MVVFPNTSSTNEASLDMISRVLSFSRGGGYDDSISEYNAVISWETIVNSASWYYKRSAEFFSRRRWRWWFHLWIQCGNLVRVDCKFSLLEITRSVAIMSWIGRNIRRYIIFSLLLIRRIAFGQFSSLFPPFCVGFFVSLQYVYSFVCFVWVLVYHDCVWKQWHQRQHYYHWPMTLI